MIIAVDFDGTCVTHEFPNVGKDIGAVPVLKRLVEKGHHIILHTMRSHSNGKVGNFDKNGNPIERDTLQDAIDWFEKNGIPLLGVNENPTQKRWTSSPKIFAHIYIDDAALGVPLKSDPQLSDRPYVNWKEIMNWLVINGIV
jgi:hypothetical protein